MHPVQQAFAAHHGLQCGYCTPGMIMAAVALLQQQAQPTGGTARLSLAPCRCTGYIQIIEPLKPPPRLWRSAAPRDRMLW
jgi:carbon-monoxide dehydrogenase small subunit